MMTVTTTDDAESLRQRAEQAEAANRTALEILEAAEWRPERNMAGGTTMFCPVCGGTPSIHRLNRNTSRPDGHWLHVMRLGGPCPLALALDALRGRTPEPTPESVS